MALVLALMAIAAIYQPGLAGPFVFDDYNNIVNNPDIAINSISHETLSKAALSSGSGVSLRPLASLSFGLNYFFFDGVANAYSFKAINLVIHLINAALIFWIAQLLFEQIQPNTKRTRKTEALPWAPLALAVVWGLHPINLTTVLYVVQRMTSLATLFMLLGFIGFIYGRQLVVSSWRRGLMLMIISAAGGTALGLLAKEIALLTPLYLLAIDYAFFRTRERKFPAVVRRFHVVSIGMLMLGVGYYLLVHWPQILLVFNMRSFTMEQRLFTEARVLWFYASLIAFPLPGRFSLFHDDVAVSTSIISPWTTAPSLIALATVASIAVMLHRRWPIVAFAVFWFLIGHSMESTLLGLEIAHEHRNYLPSLGPLLAFMHGLQSLSQRRENPALMVVPTFCILTLLASSTAARAHDWSTAEKLAATMTLYHPNSPRAHIMLGEIYAHQKNDTMRALEHYQRAASLSPHEASAHLRIALLSGTPSSLDPHFVDGVTEVLRNHPVSPDTRQALAHLSRCIVNTPHPCADLFEPAQRWYSATVDNPRADFALRHFAILTLFDIAVWRRDYLAALHAADLGKRQEPGRPVYDLMRANALILLKRYPEAEQLLESVATNDQQTSEDKENVPLLRHLLEQRQPNRSGH